MTASDHVRINQYVVTWLGALISSIH